MKQTSFSDRLAQALATSGKTRRELAAVLRGPNGKLGVSVQAVGDAINGKTRSMTAENTALAAAFLDVRFEWLSLGEPPMNALGDSSHGQTQVAQSMSLQSLTVPHTTTWEELMSIEEVPAFFSVRMPDAALAGHIEAGTELVFMRVDQGIEPSPGKTVLIEDRDGNRLIRRYAQVRGSHWQAISSSPVFVTLDSVEHGLRVLAVMRWREG